MDALNVIITKRDGGRLSASQIEWFLSRYTAGEIADEQAAALAMAIYFVGMETDELAEWTRAMVRSGTTLELGTLDRPIVDKHSTGGVGDKISLILVPLVAACGAAVPQLSGRGLGHTGGTLDKMEAIAGWAPDLSPERMRRLLSETGGFIAGATEDLAPADRKLYALRDVTGTIESIPLIASSIMSKKIAEGTSSLVLDVKVGSGAFMRDPQSAGALARTMVDIGAAHNVATTALITRMDNVLGCAVGNAVEVQEALDVLAGGGPDDVIELTIALATEMLELAGLDADPSAVLASGKAADVFEKMVRAQGGDLSAGLPQAPERQVIHAKTDGYLHALEARRIGIAAWRLGAGRARKEDSVSMTAGVLCLAKPGDRVQAGQPILELRADDKARFETVTESVTAAITIGPDQPTAMPIVVDRIGPNRH